MELSLNGKITKGMLSKKSKVQSFVCRMVSYVSKRRGKEHTSELVDT